MNRFQQSWPWVVMAALGAWIVAGTWLVAVQIMLTMWDPMGHWQMPGVSRVTVTHIGRDQDQKLTGAVWVMKAGKSQEYQFSKREAADLEVDEDVWVLAGLRTQGNRPGHFRLTPTRLLLEYPQPTILLAIWGLLALRKRQKRLARAAPKVVRKVWRDDFHQRSERFEPPKETKEP